MAKDGCGGDGADDDATLQVRAVVGSDAAEKHTMRARGPKKCPSCAWSDACVPPQCGSAAAIVVVVAKQSSRFESPPPPGDEKFMFHSCLSSVP